MAKAKNATAFEEILSGFESDDDKTSWQTLAERNPKLKEYGLRQDEFSRRLNDVKSELEQLDTWKAWRLNNWDSERDMTKREVESLDKLSRLEAEKSALETKISALGELGGENVASFDEVTKWIDDAVGAKGLVTRKDIDTEKEGIQKLVLNSQGYVAELAMETNYLNLLHQKEFGEPFDPKVFTEAATKAGSFGRLREFYDNDFVAGKRQEKVKADFESQLAKERADRESAVAKATEDGRQSALREQAMGANGQTPADLGGRQMGSFEKQYKGLKNEGTGAPEVPLGDGGIAEFAARKFIEAQTNRA